MDLGFGEALLVFGGEQSHSLVGWPLAIGVATVLAGLWSLRPGSAG